jgi:DNA-directed RNA polymerase specialized sigma24 family protein
MTLHKGTTKQFEMQRSQLVRLAYQILGSLDNAEGIVHEAWRRWQRLDPTETQAPAAYLHRLVVTLCLETLKFDSTRGLDPKLSNSISESYDGATGHDELTLTLMRSLKQSSTLERTSFLLHDVFGIPVEEVAATLHRDPAVVHELASRARRQVRGAHSHGQVHRDEGNRIAQAFFAAASSGDNESLRTLLATNVSLKMNLGGGPLTSLSLTAGLEHVVSRLGEIHRQSVDRPPVFIRSMWFEGRPGYLSVERDDILQATTLGILDGRIAAIYITENTDKFDNCLRMTSEDGPPNAVH